MTNFVEKDRGGTDIAALSGGVVAVTVSVFTASGPFVPLNAIFGISLVAIIASYVWPHARTFAQTIAVGASLGLACIPAFGYLFELLHTSPQIEGLLIKIGDQGASQLPNEKPESRVTQIDYAIIWAVALIAFSIADRVFQRKIAPTTNSADETANKLELTAELNSAVDDWAKSHLSAQVIRRIAVEKILTQHLREEGRLK